MRARNLKPGFFVNEQLAECCFAARLLFEGLWCLADRAGRLCDKPRRIKAQVFPYDDVNVDALLNELSRNGLIVRYEVDDERYIEIPKFLVHQRPHQNESPSCIPSRDEGLCTKVESTSCQGTKDFAPRKEALRSVYMNDEYMNDDVMNAVAEGNKGGMGGEEPTPAPERRDGGGEQEQMLTDYTPEEREVLSLFKGVHDLKQPDTGKLIRQIRTLKADFPVVDLLAEAKKMALWLDSREKKQNAKSNLLLFMRNWVERASKTPSPPISDLQRYKNGPPSPVPNADGSIGKADEGNAERNKRLAEKYMKQFGDRMTGGEAP